MNDALDALLGRSDAALTVLHDASDAVAALRVSCTSVDGLATVTADGAGAVVDLHLASDLSRTSASALGSSIVTAAAEASRLALERRAMILEQMQISLSDT